MSAGGRLIRAVGLLGATIVVLIAVSQALELVMPRPYSGYLAVIVVGLVATQIFKRRPAQRMLRLVRLYLDARVGGDSESAALERVLARAFRDPQARQRAALEARDRWAGPSERERAIAGLGAVLARQGVALPPEGVAAVYDRVRDRLVIPDWESLPRPFVDALRGRLGERERGELERVVERYQILRQRFFRSASALGRDPEAGVTDFARLLASLGNRLANAEPGDAERVYRLSLALRPERNLAHAGLALVLERTGRTREATAEARTALAVLDDYAQRAGAEAPTAEDISVFGSPARLRETMARIAGEAAEAGGAGSDGGRG